MAEIETLMGVSATDIEKVMGVSAGDIESVMGVELVTSQSYMGNRAVALGAGQVNTGIINVIEYKAMSSDSDTLDFGDLSTVRKHVATVGNDTRAVGMSGITGGGGTQVNTIEYITIASTGNTTDFGDSTQARSRAGGMGSGTRGIHHTGYVWPDRVDTLDYITVASTGDATDFGNAIRNTASAHSGNAHSTRGIFWMGWDGDYSNLDANYITFASTGNASDFGDWSAAVAEPAAIGLIESKNIWGGGYTSGAGSEWATMEYINPNSTGNTTSQGDLGSATVGAAGKFTNGTRGELWGGSYYAHSEVQKITNIASDGDASHAGNVRDPSGGSNRARDAWGGWTGD